MEFYDENGSIFVDFILSGTMRVKISGLDILDSILSQLNPKHE